MCYGALKASSSRQPVIKTPKDVPSEDDLEQEAIASAALDARMEKRHPTLTRTRTFPPLQADSPLTIKKNDELESQVEAELMKR